MQKYQEVWRYFFPGLFGLQNLTITFLQDTLADSSQVWMDGNATWKNSQIFLSIRNSGSRVVDK